MNKEIERDACLNCKLSDCKPRSTRCALRQEKAKENNPTPAPLAATAADPLENRKTRTRGGAHYEGKIDRDLVLQHLEAIRTLARRRRNGAICISLPDRGKFAAMGLLGTPQPAGKIWWLQIKSRWLAEQLGNVTPARIRRGSEPAGQGDGPTLPAWSLAAELLRFVDKTGLDRKRQVHALRLAAAAIETEIGD